jgi:DNA-binding CsgD family transcriptional regulator
MREREVIKLLIAGQSSKEIADSLCLSIHTISSHRKSVIKKLGVQGTTGMVAKALDLGLG